MEETSSDFQSLAIKIDGVSKSFNSRLALRGINLEVAQGESIVIFGPNGAGKTTLIKLLATIMKPSSGSIVIDGLDLKDSAEEIHRRIGVVTHQTFLYSNLTAYENLEFYSRMYDVPEYGERIQEVVSLMGMTSRLYDRVGTLSRGMRQRLSIARALLHKPAIMLLDEPEAGLDQESISMLWNAIDAEGDGKRSVVLVTHNLEQGLKLADRVLILNRGEVVYESSNHVLNLVNFKEVYESSTMVRI